MASAPRTRPTKLTVYVCPGCGDHDVSPFSCGEEAKCRRAEAVEVVPVDRLLSEGAVKAVARAAFMEDGAANFFGAERKAEVRQSRGEAWDQEAMPSSLKNFHRSVAREVLRALSGFLSGEGSADE